jgi:hypothetical protein
MHFFCIFQFITVTVILNINHVSEIFKNKTLTCFYQLWRFSKFTATYAGDLHNIMYNYREIIEVLEEKLSCVICILCRDLLDAVTNSHYNLHRVYIYKPRIRSPLIVIDDSLNFTNFESLFRQLPGKMVKVELVYTTLIYKNIIIFITLKYIDIMCSVCITHDMEMHLQ